MPDTTEQDPPKAKPVRLYVAEKCGRQDRLDIYKKWMAQEDLKVRKLHDKQTSGLKKYL